jgi:hypothetical protein
MSLDPKSRIGVWDTGYTHVHPLMVEEGDGWRDLRLGDLVSLIRDALRAENELCGVLLEAHRTEFVAAFLRMYPFDVGGHAASDAAFSLAAFERGALQHSEDV